MQKSKAKVSPIKLGLIEFEGLLLPDGSFAIAVSQVATLFSLDKTVATREVKALLGGRFPLDKFASELHSQKVNVISIEALELVLRKLDRKGNAVAQGIVDDLIGLSLHQLYCDAFEMRFEKEERQAFLVERQKSKDFYKDLSAAVQWYYCEYEKRDRIPSFAYNNAADAINLGLFGKKSKVIREELGVPKAELIRDNFSFEAVHRIETIEELSVTNIRDRKMKPVEAVKSAIATFNYQPIEYRKCTK